MKVDKIKTALLSILAVLAPVQTAMITAFGLIAVDFMLGIAASIHNKQPITSARLKVTVVKVLVYELAIVAAFFVGTYLTGPDVPVLQMVTSMVGLTELKSVLENLQALSGDTLLGAIVTRLQGAQSSDAPGASQVPPPVGSGTPPPADPV